LAHQVHIALGTELCRDPLENGAGIIQAPRHHQMPDQNTSPGQAIGIEDQRPDLATSG
jgi:hypothetical protein